MKINAKRVRKDVENGDLVVKHKGWYIPVSQKHLGYFVGIIEIDKNNNPIINDFGQVICKAI